MSFQVVWFKRDPRLADHDPDARFIKTWVPELKTMNEAQIHTPWHFPDNMNGYPEPLVDETQAREQAAAKIYQLKKQPGYRDIADRIVLKHGSRKKPNHNRTTGRQKEIVS